MTIVLMTAATRKKTMSSGTPTIRPGYAEYRSAVDVFEAYHRGELTIDEATAEMMRRRGHQWDGDAVRRAALVVLFLAALVMHGLNVLTG